MRTETRASLFESESPLAINRIGHHQSIGFKLEIIIKKEIERIWTKNQKWPFLPDSTQRRAVAPTKLEPIVEYDWTPNEQFELSIAALLPRSLHSQTSSSRN
jgi:hypothetical protein